MNILTKNGIRTIVAALLLVALAGGGAAAAEGVLPEGTVACLSPGALWGYLDARDNNDRLALAALFKGECRRLDGRSYQLMDDRNGTAEILVFRQAGHWETAETFYTLAEMLDIE
jgi:hypothetical protein